MNILGQDGSSIPSISIDDFTLYVVEEFICLHSSISSNLSLDAKQIRKAATAMARLVKRLWENYMQTTNPKMEVYVREAWTLCSRQERRLNNFHLHCLRRRLGITYGKAACHKNVLHQAGLPSMFALLTKWHLHWLGQVR